MNKYQKAVQKRFVDNEEAAVNELKNVYTASYKDIQKEIEKLDMSIEQLQKAYDSVGEDDIGALARALLRKKKNYTPDEAKDTLASMLQSKIYQRDYQRALEKQVENILDELLKGEFKTISEYLKVCYEDGFVGTLFDLQAQGIPLCFPLNQEAVANAVRLDSKINKGLYSHLGENVSELKEKIAAEVSRGISSALSTEQIALNIGKKMLGTYNNPGGSYAYALRIAGTEGHRIQCQATMDSCYNAKERGADVVKMWDSVLDGKTRESHQQVDGEIRELDEKFSNGLMFPGDPSGTAAEVCNCRCALLQRARWALEGSFTKYDNFSREIKTFEDSQAYDEFKKAYYSEENTQFMNYVESLESRYETKNFNTLLEKMNDSEYSRFVELQEKRPIFNGMYRSDDVIKKSTQTTADILTKSSNGAITKNGSVRLQSFAKVDVDDIPPMAEERFNTIKGNLTKKGVSVIQDTDGDDYLKYMGAEAMTLSDGSAVIFQSERIPSASAVFEEIIHTTQIKNKGIVESTGNIQDTLEYLHREIEANEKLLKHQKAYNLTEKDVKSVQENLEIYYNKLKEVEENV